MSAIIGGAGLEAGGFRFLDDVGGIGLAGGSQRGICKARSPTRCVPSVLRIVIMLGRAIHFVGLAGGGIELAGRLPIECAVKNFIAHDALVALKDLVAISNGSACTSSSYTPSHVIKAMRYSDDEANEAIRLSWCHLTPEVDWEGVAGRISSLR